MHHVWGVLRHKDRKRVFEEMKGIFVIGTDTGVGKTVVSALLCLLLKERGYDVGVMKPIETGVKEVEGVLVPQDALLLKEASGSQDPLEFVVPYYFREPLAPAEAARHEGREIKLYKILEVLKKVSKRHDLMVVEGVGGLLVPLREDTLLPELIKAFGLKVLVVGRSGLGTINHTLLTLYYCERENIPVGGFLLNKINPSLNGSEGTNPYWIERFSGVPYLGTLPFLGEGHSILERKSLLLPLFEASIKVDILLERFDLK
jgi:dethiobiotin synthetase